LWALVNLPIPYLADMCMVQLADDEDGPGKIEWAWKDPATGKSGNHNSLSFAPPLSSSPWLERVIAQVSMTRTPTLIKDFPSVVPENLRQKSSVASNDVNNSAIPAFPPLGSAMVLPLVGQGEMLGILLLGLELDREKYQECDVSLASILSNRASVALENAILIEKIREADRRKDEFLGMLAHELRNPLGPIRNAVQLMQMIGTKDVRLEKATGMVERQVAHMTRLIDDLLDATRLASGKVLLRKERCDLAQIVRQTAEDYRSIFDASGLALEVSVPNAPVWIDGDPTRLVQAIGNLLHNAHKFTDPGGLVTVKLEHDVGHKVACVGVKDTGNGIVAKVLTYVFEVFRQAEQGLDRTRGGLGLGLALVKGLVELHDGEVSVNSAGPGQGAEFTIRLPTELAAAMPANPEFHEAEQKGEKYRILIIEDNQDAAQSACALLKLEGYEVRASYTGQAGLDIARDMHPRVILCDIGLPGMDGYQVARALRQEQDLSSTYIIAMTGYGRDEDQQRAFEAGFDQHLTKPIDYNSLRRVLTGLPKRAL
jgi:signal transduction histidine kinase/CheY-like chemotaxis protein